MWSYIVSEKLAAVGPQGCRAGVPYAGVRHYGDGVHLPRVAGAVVQSGGTWYTIMLVQNGTNKCFRGADWRDHHYVWRRRGLTWKQDVKILDL